MNANRATDRGMSSRQRDVPLARRHILAARQDAPYASRGRSLDDRIQIVREARIAQMRMCVDHARVLRAQLAEDAGTAARRS